MIKSLLLAAALLGICSTTSFAQRGSLTLGWNNCRVHGGGLADMGFSCDSNSGAGPLLVGGFIPSASANLNSLNSGFLYVDIFQGSSSMLEAWWQFTDPPVSGCRPLNTWSLDMNNASGAQCDRSYWQEVGGTVSALRWFYPSYVQGHGTLRILVAVDSELARVTTPIGPDQESHIFSARLGRQRTIGADACAGCADDASLYFAQADFFQTNLDNFVIDGVGFANWPVDGPKCVSWQQGAHPSGYRCLMIVDPTHNATWGSIKSLYR